MRTPIGRLAAIAALLGADPGLPRAALPDIRLPSAVALDMPPYPRPSGATKRHRTPGRHNPAGTKLWKKAKEGKL